MALLSPPRKNPFLAGHSDAWESAPQTDRPSIACWRDHSTGASRNRIREFFQVTGNFHLRTCGSLVSSPPCLIAWSRSLAQSDRRVGIRPIHGPTLQPTLGWIRMSQAMVSPRDAQDFDLLRYSSQRWRSQCVSIDATTSGISARWHGGDCRGPSSITSMARRTMRSRIGEIPKPTSGAIWCPTFSRVSKASTCR